MLEKEKQRSRRRIGRLLGQLYRRSQAHYSITWDRPVSLWSEDWRAEVVSLTCFPGPSPLFSLLSPSFFSLFSLLVFPSLFSPSILPPYIPCFHHQTSHTSRSVTTLSTFLFHISFPRLFLSFLCAKPSMLILADPSIDSYKVENLEASIRMSFTLACEVFTFFYNCVLMV